MRYVKKPTEIDNPNLRCASSKLILGRFPVNLMMKATTAPHSGFKRLI